MAAPEIRVRITGDSKGLEGATKKAEKTLSNLDRSSLRTATSATKLNKSVANATPTLQEFSRVIQDAPFGIQGVGNNITQLVSNFGNLSKAAGGSGAAIKALLGSFIGPAGILFAVSTAVSLLTVYGDKLFRSASATKELNKATLDFAADAKSEITTLQQLLAIAGDETQSREKRAEAVAVLQKKYPDYLKNLSTENSTTKEIKKSVDALIQSLELRARVQGAQELITQKAKDLLEKQQKAQDQYNKTIDNIPESLQRAEQANKSYARGIGTTSQEVFDAAKNEARQREIANDRLSDSLSEAEKEYAKYVKNLTNILSSAPSLAGAFGADSKKTGKEIKPPKFKFSTVNLEGLEAIGVQAGETLQKSLSEQQNAVRKGLGEMLDKPLADSLRIATPHLERLSEKFNLAQEAGNAFASSVGQGIGQLGNLLASTFQTGIGVLDIFINTLISGIAQIAASFAQKAILDRLFSATTLAANLTASNANAITIASSAAAGLGPLGFAALPGLLAATLAQVNTAFAAIPKFAQGGLVGGGSFSGDQILARLNSGERILTIQDQSLLSRILDGNMRGINNNPGVVPIEGIIRGPDILLANKRAERNSRRFGR